MTSYTISIVSAYSFPQCKDGVIDLAETQPANIVCEGLDYSEIVNWAMIGDKKSEVSDIGGCGSCPSATCSQCTVSSTDFTVTRNRSHSELTITGNVRQIAGETILCSRGDNHYWVTCDIRVVCEYPRSCKVSLCPLRRVFWFSVSKTSYCPRTQSEA